MPTKRNIVIGQRVSSEKVARAKELRRTMTLQENMLWQRLRSNQLDDLHFRRQQVIDGFIADFYCHAAGKEKSTVSKLAQRTKPLYDPDFE